MEKLDPNSAKGGRNGWPAAIGMGVIVCLLSGMILNVVVGFFFPALTDPYPPPTDIPAYLSHAVGVAILLVSVGAGVWQAIRYRGERK